MPSVLGVQRLPRVREDHKEAATRAPRWGTCRGGMGPTPEQRVTCTASYSAILGRVFSLAIGTLPAVPWACQGLGYFRRLGPMARERPRALRWTTSSRTRAFMAVLRTCCTRCHCRELIPLTTLRSVCRQVNSTVSCVLLSARRCPPLRTPRTVP